MTEHTEDKHFWSGVRKPGWFERLWDAILNKPERGRHRSR